MNSFVDILPSGATLGPGNRVVSFSGQLQLILQGDGNLVIYDPTNTPLWASDTNGFPGAFLRIQNDGNCVIYTEAAIVDTAHHHSPIIREDHLRIDQLNPVRRYATVAELIAAVVYCPV